MSVGTGSSRQERRPDRAALVIALLLLLLAGVIAWDAATISSGVASYARIGPKVFPYGIAAGLAILAVLTAVSAFTDMPGEREKVEFPPVLWVIGGLLAQIALLPFAGFSIATGAVFAATAKAFGRGPLWLTYPIGVGFSLAVWLAFSMALKLVLPAGPLERYARTITTQLVDLATPAATWLYELVRGVVLGAMGAF